MSCPAELMIDGRLYRRVDSPNRVRTYQMYDCHLFHHIEGATIDEVIERWRGEYLNPLKDYGAPMLCPVIVMEGERELRRVGKSVFKLNEVEDWRKAVVADPDIARLLAERKTTTTAPQGDSNG